MAQILALKVASQVTDDVGPQIADGRPLPHRFRLNNPTDTPIRLVEAVASTPCCSSIGPLPPSIPTHGNVDVPVEFRPGYQAGRKRIRFLVATDRDDCPRIELFLTADLHPSWEVAAADPAPIHTRIGEPLSRQFRIVTRRRATEGRPPVAQLSINGPLTVRFEASSQPNEQRSGELIEFEQVCRIEAPARSEPEVVASELRLHWADGATQTHPIRWEVTSPIRITPQTIVVRADEQAHRVALTVQSDDQPIRILSVAGTGLAGSVNLPHEAAPRQRLDLMIDATKPEAAASGVEIRTDHPTQSCLRLKLLVIPSQSEVIP